jgi:hypothetical protein
MNLKKKMKEISNWNSIRMKTEKFKKSENCKLNSIHVTYILTYIFIYLYELYIFTHTNI